MGCMVRLFFWLFIFFLSARSNAGVFHSIEGFIEHNQTTKIAIIILDMQEYQKHLPGTPVLWATQRNLVELAVKYKNIYLALVTHHAGKDEKGEVTPISSFILSSVTSKKIKKRILSFEKRGFDAFENGLFDIQLRLKGITHLIISGGYTRLCLKPTVCSAIGKGYRVLIGQQLSTSVWPLSKMVEHCSSVCGYVYPAFPTYCGDYLFCHLQGHYHQNYVIESEHWVLLQSELKEQYPGDSYDVAELPYRGMPAFYSSGGQ